MTDRTFEELNDKLDRLIQAVSRLGPPVPAAPDFTASDCFVWRAETSAASLKKTLRISPTVVRRGARRQIDIAMLVPGDVVLLESGAAVPGDLRLLSTHDLKCDESLLTGESAPVDKQADAATRFLARHGAEIAGHIDLRCGDGLGPLRDDELDALILAGLGERLICAILGAVPDRLRHVRELFCMPLKRRGRLHPFLDQHGFVEIACDTAIEKGRYYPLYRFARRTDRP